MGVTTIHAHGPVSVAEFEALPDDGNRYELLDGTVYVTPPPVVAHGVALSELQHVLRTAAPDGLLVVQVVGYQASPGTVFVPDLMVIPAPAPAGRYVTEPPLLVVEALSRSSRTHDRVRKLAAYQAAGVGAYWILDPDEPSLLVLDRDGDRLVERAHVRGAERHTATHPFAVTVTPAELVARVPR